QDKGPSMNFGSIIIGIAVDILLLTQYGMSETCPDIATAILQSEERMKSFITTLIEKHEGETQANIENLRREIIGKCVGAHWGDWGEWSVCDTTICNIAHRIRKCYDENDEEVDPSHCGKTGDHIEKKQCCEELQKIEKKKFYKSLSEDGP
ncbi:unnamed protein product, partial [Owenia fusiformis]